MAAEEKQGKQLLRQDDVHMDGRNYMNGEANPLAVFVRDGKDAPVPGICTDSWSELLPA